MPWWCVTKKKKISQARQGQGIDARNRTTAQRNATLYNATQCSVDARQRQDNAVMLVKMQGKRSAKKCIYLSLIEVWYEPPARRPDQTRPGYTCMLLYLGTQVGKVRSLKMQSE